MSQQCFKNKNPTRNLRLNIKHVQPLFSGCLLGSQGDPEPRVTATAELHGGSVWQGHSPVSSVDLV